MCLALRLRNEQKKTEYLLRQTRNLEPLEESASVSTIEAENDISELTSKKTMKRDSWSNNQTGALINDWKEHFYEIETYQQPSA